MQQRHAHLVYAETQHGFVYDAERLWLEAVMHAPVFEKYADWLLKKLNQHLFDKPLLWGVEEQGDIVPGLTAANIWYAEMGGGIDPIVYPFNLTEDTDIANFSIFFTLRVYGTRERPDPVYLVYAFRRLFNFPYHALVIKHRLICRDKVEGQNADVVRIDEYVQAGIESVYPENPLQWLLTFGNHYDSWEGLKFIGREGHSVYSHPRPCKRGVPGKSNSRLATRQTNKPPTYSCSTGQ